VKGNLKNVHYVSALRGLERLTKLKGWKVKSRGETDSSPKMVNDYPGKKRSQGTATLQMNLETGEKREEKGV